MKQKDDLVISLLAHLLAEQSLTNSLLLKLVSHDEEMESKVIALKNQSAAMIEKVRIKLKKNHESTRDNY